MLEHGFAYGREGTALRGKVLLNAITTGGPQDAYRPDGYNRFTVRQLLAPFDQTAALCGMHYLAPFTVHRSLLIATAADAEPHARAWRAAVTALVAGTLDRAAAAGAERLNDVLAPPPRPRRGRTGPGGVACRPIFSSRPSCTWAPPWSRCPSPSGWDWDRCWGTCSRARSSARTCSASWAAAAAT